MEMWNTGGLTLLKVDVRGKCIHIYMHLRLVKFKSLLEKQGKCHLFGGIWVRKLKENLEEDVYI